MPALAGIQCVVIRGYPCLAIVNRENGFVHSPTTGRAVPEKEPGKQGTEVTSALVVSAPLDLL